MVDCRIVLNPKRWHERLGRFVLVLAVAAVTVAAMTAFVPAEPAFAAGPKIVTLTSSSDPSTYAQPVTFTATVSPSLGFGTLTFLESKGSSPHNYLVTVCPTTNLSYPVSGGWGATCRVTLPPGSHPIVARFTSVGNIHASGSLIQQVETHVATTTSVTSSLNPSRTGNGVTFTATVAPAIAGVIQGTVEFRAGGSPLAGCTSQPVTDNQAACTVSSLPIGPTKIKATFGNAPSHAFDGSSGTLEQQVKPYSVPPSHGGKKTVVVTSSLDPSVYGQDVTFTATVSPDRGDGTVTFFEPIPLRKGVIDFTFCSAEPLVKVGGQWQATCTVAPPAGYLTVVARFVGTGGVGASGQLNQIVSGVPTTTTLSSSVNPSLPGQAVTFTAVVNPSNAVGEVTFRAGRQRICPTDSVNIVDGIDEATCTTSTLKTRHFTITAFFQNDQGQFGSSTGTLHQVVGAGGGGAVESLALRGSGASFVPISWTSWMSAR
jgi:large repetitive protein